METNSLNGWLRAWGYKWVPGKEQMMKGNLTNTEAQSIVSDLSANGAIVRG